MIGFWMEDDRRRSDIQAFLRIFFPFEDVQMVDDSELADVRLYNGSKELNVWVRHNSSIYERSGSGDTFDLRRMLLDIYMEITFPKPSWGILMGIRPTKLVFKMLEKGYGNNRIITELTDRYMLDTDKATLLLDVCKAEKSFVAEAGKSQIYIGIPFCPSRCSYCSFAAYEADKYRDEIPAYLDCLYKEMEGFSDVFKEAESVYIGGGTPTTLDEGQLDTLLGYVAGKVSDKLKEFTVEAGRPDTITTGKLDAMRRHGVTRISINPQSFNDVTLKKIGRNHTANEVVEVFNAAKGMGFASVNMDLIAGLPGETAAEVEKTMDKVAALLPDNVTVHTLAIKRAAKLSETGGYDTMEARSEIEPMLRIIYDRLSDLGYKPYYLYRQKQMLGQFENVGFERSGTPCLYNIHMIEETSPVYAFGAGTVSKQITSGKITRQDNPKNIHAYISGIDQIIAKKQQLYYNNGKQTKR